MLLQESGNVVGILEWQRVDDEPVHAQCRVALRGRSPDRVQWQRREFEAPQPGDGITFTFANDATGHGMVVDVISMSRRSRTSSAPPGLHREATIPLSPTPVARAPGFSWSSPVAPSRPSASGNRIADACQRNRQREKARAPWTRPRDHTAQQNGLATQTAKPNASPTGSDSLEREHFMNTDKLGHLRAALAKLAYIGRRSPTRSPAREDAAAEEGAL